jgi:microcystin degradation protein MlrC
MKIFAAGIATETNTFSPIPTSIDDFQVQRGREALAGRIEHPSLDLTNVWGQQATARGDSFIFSLMAWAQPAGTTIRAAYESLRDEILADLIAAQPVDVVLLNLHGAMVAQGYDDCEEDLLRCVRSIVGPETVIGVELDLHCHLSDSKIAPADIVVTYKEYPHTDVNDRARELFDLAIAARLGEIHPNMTLVDCQMIGLYPTTRQPLREFVDAMEAAEHRKGVLSVSFGHGFQFADVPHVGAKVLVVTDRNPALARAVATEFADRAYDMRGEMGCESFALPLGAALVKATSAGRGPVIVADQSDNVGGGAPGDSTFALRWLIEHHIEDTAVALIYDPEVVRIAKRWGIGTPIPVRLGGKIGPTSGQPIDIDVTVLSIRDNYLHAFPQAHGEPIWYRAGDVVALRTGGSIDIVVSSERCQCMSPSIFTDLGIDAERKRILVVKSVQHFYGAFAPIAAQVVYMAGPGAVAPDPKLITYRRLNTARLYPWAEDPRGARL